MRLAALRVASIALATMTLPVAALAQPTPTPAPSPSASPNIREIGHVSTSDRRDEPVSNTSRPTYVVDRAHIDAYGARTVYDALVDVPGVELYSYGGFGAQVNYGLRGSNSEQTLVLVDGQPIASADSGSSYLQQLSTIGVQRIEIVESGSSTLYGTSASGGVINVITAVPRTEYLSVSGGSFADRDVRVEAGNGVVGGAFERHVVDNNYGFSGLAYNQANTFPAGTRENAYADQTSVRAVAAVPLGNGYSANLRVDDAALNEGVPGGFEFGLTQNVSQGLSNETADLHIAKTDARSTVSLDVSGALQRLTYVYPLEDDTYTGRTQISLKGATNFGHADLVTGIDLSRETGVFSFPSMPIYNSDYTTVIGTAPPSATGAAQSQAAAYAQIGVDVGKPLRIIGGLRAEHDSPAGSVLAPSFGGILRSGNLRLTGNLGESFRVPTLLDLYYPGDSNPNLLPEKAATFDTTLAFDGRDASFSAGWFGRSGSNFIVLAPPLYVPVNASSAATAGLQFTARSRPFGGIVFDASFTDLYLARNRSTGARLPEVPVGSATLGITKIDRGDRLSYGVRWRIIGDDGDDVANAGTNAPVVGRYDAYDNLDAFVRYKLTPSAVLSIRGFNLGDEAAAPIYGYPAPGRRLYVELATR